MAHASGEVAWRRAVLVPRGGEVAQHARGEHVRAAAQQSKLYVGMVLILIFAEALGLYGLIVGLIMSSNLSAFI